MSGLYLSRGFIDTLSGTCKLLGFGYMGAKELKCLWVLSWCNWFLVKLRFLTAVVCFIRPDASQG